MEKNIKTDKQFKTTRILIFVLFLVIIYCYHLIFGKFFPNQQQNMGIDYSYFLPMLLNGYYWFQVNGLSEIPWFTPAFCAGIPYFPNPQVMYYSVPQFLVFIFDPLSSVYITFILFAFLGFIGFFLLLRNVFLLTPEASLFGATVFLFNGFYAHRMIIGHLTYHSFMLIPFIAYLLLKLPPGNNNELKINKLVNIFFAGFLIAYMMHSGMANFIVPALLSVIGIWMICKICDKGYPGFWIRLGCAGIIAVLLSASKLVAGITYLRNFPRDYYTLPGIEGIFESLLFVLKALFFGINASTEKWDIVNYVIEIEYFQHEVEYSVTFIPLLILICYTFFLLRRLIKTDTWSKISWHKKRIMIVFFSLLILPVILNIYTPAWNEFLKNLPYIKSSSALLRWIAMEIPLVAIIASLALNIIKNQNLKFAVIITGIAGVILVNILQDRDWYHEQIYSPNDIVNAYNASRQNGKPPEIRYIGAYLTGKNKFDPNVINRNDVLIKGVSQLACNEPIFGYKLERFPFGEINTGEVLNIRNGFFNIKDPSCYVFGNINGCSPGQHFTASRGKAVEDFINYRPLEFKMPLLQVIVNRVNWFTLLYLIFFLVFIILNKIYKSGRIVNLINKNIQ